MTQKKNDIVNHVCLAPNILLKNECYYCHLKGVCSFWDRDEIGRRWEKAMELMERDMKKFDIDEWVPWRKNITNKGKNNE